MFELLTESSEEEGTVEQHGLSQSSIKQQKKYLRFEFTTLTLQGQERELLKIVDVSDTMLNSQFKQQNEMLSIINATVSHELRNPLNSIIGQNVNKEGLLGELAGLIADPQGEEGVAKAGQIERRRGTRRGGERCVGGGRRGFFTTKNHQKTTFK